MALGSVPLTRLERNRIPYNFDPIIVDFIRKCVVFVLPLIVVKAMVRILGDLATERKFLGLSTMGLNFDRPSVLPLYSGTTAYGPSPKAW